MGPRCRLRTRIAAIAGRLSRPRAPRSRKSCRRSGDRSSGTSTSALSELGRTLQTQRLARREARRPFDLERGPLLRLTLLELDERDHVLLLTMHHITGDGWSTGLLSREIGVLYRACCQGVPSPLPALPIQYADFAHWQRRWLRAEVLEAEVSYWRQELEGLPALLELPWDRPRPAVQRFRGAALAKMLPDGLHEALRGLSRGEGVTLFVTLLAALQVLRFSTQPA
ncbi:MAG: hypothetical protein GY856_26415 [bacterium]|nr:hypothetical protein [bacterium]